MTFKVGDFLAAIKPTSPLTQYCQVKEVFDYGVYKVKYNGLKEVRVLCENRALDSFVKVNFSDINWCKGN